MKTRQTHGRWIKVKPANYVKPTENVDVGVFVSPYDIPDGLRVGYNGQLHRIVVEFRYMIDEKHRRLDRGDGVCYLLGKHSDRIVGVEADLQNSEVSVEDHKNTYDVIGHAMRNVETATGAKARRRKNYLVAKKVVEDHQDDIVQGMRHALGG